MAARKKSTAAANPDTEQGSQHVDDTGPGDIAVDEQFAAEQAPATPVSRIRVRGVDESAPARAGGHVLTEKGWVRE